MNSRFVLENITAFDSGNVMLTSTHSDAHSVGFELDQFYFSGPMANMQAAGHTGFTGTSLGVDRVSVKLYDITGTRYASESQLVQ